MSDILDQANCLIDHATFLRTYIPGEFQGTSRHGRKEEVINPTEAKRVVDKCEWNKVNFTGTFVTQCGVRRYTGFKYYVFCPYCGKKIEFKEKAG